MSASASLQIPSSDPSPSPGPSRQFYSSSAASARPVSVAVQPSPAPPQHHPSSARRQQRASHTPVSSHNPHNHTDDSPPAHIDVYAHPAAVAYAAAHPRRQIPKFGPYLLLQTLGEGEFGKVKLGLHTIWGEEVAVKLIRRGNVDSAVRMSKIEREIEVLRILKHPNIVRLYDVIETDKYIGIILEYASGGELFDHILAHRYLRERDAAKLFSQLISGVWYIHEKKIVHRDLKLENLLLDRNRNVIITDFGFANRFEHRADDLMQTSCGSPCYAAPELVISEGLYVGSAVDIWSCGVILYAMLAGYLPFDDDPANPDGDNINLLYKYIVSTPLSFPDYISPEARDLLSIMLVPDPTRRSSLQGVMKHPWLSAYAIPDDSEPGASRAFGRTVDDLERVAMEQHQQKRLAYQKQMRTLAAQTTTPSSPDPRAARSMSYRPAEPNTQSPNPASGRSKSSQPTQSDYIYQSSAATADPSATPTHADTSHRAYGGGPSAAIGVADDDPFAGPGGGGSSSNKKVSPRKDGGKAPAEMLSPQPKNQHQKAATSPDHFRHTIQVEYDAPLPTPKGGKKSEDKDKRPSTREKPSSNQPTPNGSPSSANGMNENGSPSQQRSGKEKRMSTTKPLPLPPVPPSKPPTSYRSPTENDLPDIANGGTPTKRGNASTTADSTPMPSKIPIVSINVASPPNTPGKSTSANREASDESVSQGSVSSKKGGHRKGVGSLDKIGFAKIFGGGSNASADHDRVPSDAPSANSSVLLSPSGSEREKEAGATRKGRRNTLTVMVEPIINRTMRSRTTKGRTAATPIATEGPSATSGPAKHKSKVREEKEKAKSAQIPQSAVMDKPYNEDLGVIDRDSTGLQASTKKARKVMQWFRTKSKGARDSLGPDPLLGEDEKSMVASPVQVFVTTPGTPGPDAALAPAATIVPPTPRTPLPAKPQRAASTANGNILSTPSLVKRFRTSVTVATAGMPFSSSSHSKTGAMRTRTDGPVDRTMVTTAPPAEAMRRVRQILEEMGLEIQVETEFKVKCVRPKRKKGVVGGGMANVEAAGSSSAGNLAALTMVGTAASNGVDRRGLPLPSQSTFSATGGMLRGLLMRRQPSQASSPVATTPTTGIGNLNQSLTYDEENSTVVINDSVVINDTAYGDPNEDAGDEVRFSVELTKLNGLSDTYSLVVRRIKGSLRSYKYLYDTLRQRANLQGLP